MHAAVYSQHMWLQQQWPTLFDCGFYPVKQSTPQLSFKSSLFPVTVATCLFLLPSYSFFPPILSHSFGTSNVTLRVYKGECYFMKVWCSQTWLASSGESHLIPYYYSTLYTSMLLRVLFKLILPIWVTLSHLQRHTLICMRRHGG